MADYVLGPTDVQDGRFEVCLLPAKVHHSAALRPVRGGQRSVYLPPHDESLGVELHPKDVRWAAAEGVGQDVIAAVLLLHERSLDEIAPQLNATWLEQVIARGKPRRLVRNSRHLLPETRLAG